MSVLTGTERSIAVQTYLQGLQSRIVNALSTLDGHAFRSDSWTRPAGGGGTSCLIEEGHLIERGGVNFSHVMGEQLPLTTAMHGTACAWGNEGVAGSQPWLRQYSANAYCKPEDDALNMRCARCCQMRRPASRCESASATSSMTTG